MSAAGGALSRRLKLPVELVTTILEYVEIPYREIHGNEMIKRPNRFRDPLNPYFIARRTLLSACLASRNFNVLARRFLYQHVMLLHATDIVLLFRTLLVGGRGSGDSDDDSSQNPRSRVQYELRSSIENLACLVTLFDQASITEATRAWPLLSLPLYIKMEDMTILSLANLGLGRILDEEVSEQYCTTLQRLFAALLGLTTHLGCVTIQCPYQLCDDEGYTALDTVVRSLRRNRAVGPGTLARLHTLVVHPESGYRVTHRVSHGPTLLASLLELPTLRTLIARSYTGPLDVAGLGGPGALGLERVALYGSCNLRLDVGGYAALCPGLHRLEIYGTPADVRGLDVALGPVADRIRSLVLRLLPGSGNDIISGGPSNASVTTATATVSSATSSLSVTHGDSDGDGAWLGATYKKLEHLTVEDRILFRDTAQMETAGLARRLPESLVTLVLVGQWVPPNHYFSSSSSSGRPGGGEAEAGAEAEPARNHLAAVARTLLYVSMECAGRLPRLRRVVLDRIPQRRAWQGTPAGAWFMTQQYPEIRRSFAEAGVKFVVVRSPAAAANTSLSRARS